MITVSLPRLYNQQDPRWANFLLGFNTLSTFNMYNYGCLVTDFAMIATYYGHQIDPGELNKAFTDKNCFAGGGNYIWGSVKRLFPDIIDTKTDTPGPLTDAQLAEIKTALDQGYPVIVNIDYNPATVKPDFHYVTIVGYNPQDENDFIIADPIGGVIKSLKQYLGMFSNARKTIQQYCIVRGPVPQKTHEGMMQISIKDNERNVTKATYFDDICRFFNLDTNTMSSRDIITMITAIINNLAEADKQLKDLKQLYDRGQTDLYNALQEMKRQDERIRTIEKAQGMKPEPTAFQQSHMEPAKVEASPYTIFPADKQSLLSKVLSFFKLTLDEYSRVSK